MNLLQWIRRIVTAFCLALILHVVVPPETMACLWDYDTLQQERSRFPSALELITGKFPRHGRTFYEWRISDRLKKIENKKPTPEWLDDLAVAYDKLGQHDEAIATMDRAEKLFPGRYETAANLGTFYFHAHRLQEGIPYIERALQINPKAHFGREKYQLMLVKYVLSRQADGKTQLPLATITSEGSVGQGGFRQFVLQDIPQQEHRAEINRAVTGVLGMMRFGKYDSPILLEALGDLLALETPSHDPGEQQLSSRAFLQAHFLTADQPEVSASYRCRAEYVLLNQTGGTGQNGALQLSELEAVFQKELADAQQWYANLERQESEWTLHDPDPDARYAAASANAPDVADYTDTSRFSLTRRPLHQAIKIVLVFFLLALLALVFTFYVFARLTQKRSSYPQSHKGAKTSHDPD